MTGYIFFIKLLDRAASNKEMKNQMKNKKGLIAEFKEFISRGNVIDLAVGVIIGGAFNKIVTSLVNDILMPIIGVLFGNLSVSEYAWKINDDTVLAYGSFIQNVIDFVLIGFFVFLIVKGMNAYHAKLKRKEEKEEKEVPAKPSQEELLAEIRDLLKAQAEKEY